MRARTEKGNRSASLSISGGTCSNQQAFRICKSRFRSCFGRLDYIDGAGVAAIVYRRRGGSWAKIEPVQGFNIRRWTEQGLNFWAVSDINAEELQEFGQKF